MMDFTATCASLLVSVLLFTSCSQWTNGDYTKNVRAWHGTNITQVIARFGQPTQTIAHGQQTSYLYRQFSTQTSGTPLAPVIGINGQGRQVTIMTPNSALQPNISDTSLCEVTFVADRQGKIVDEQSTGAGCNTTFAK